MVTKEWVAIHRKHHAKVETREDPHSPQVEGINRVLWGGVILYVRESRNPATLSRYGHGTPGDWIERNLYSKHVKIGLVLMGLADVALFGPVPGALIYLAQIAWIPFWAAGVINGVGHFWGYRNFPTADASTNILPWGIVIGGEELHNNHHAFTTSAKFSSTWYEFDIGWTYIRMLEALKLAKVKRIAPIPRFHSPAEIPDLQTLQAVITHRYDVQSRYAGTLKRIGAEERNADVLDTVHSMGRELKTLWERSTVSKEQLVSRLQDWCRRAETSGVGPLVEFSRRLRSYAPAAPTLPVRRGTVAPFPS